MVVSSFLSRGLTLYQLETSGYVAAIGVCEKGVPFTQKAGQHSPAMQTLRFGQPRPMVFLLFPVLSFAVLGSSCSDGPPAHPLLFFVCFLLWFFVGTVLRCCYSKLVGSVHVQIRLQETGSCEACHAGCEVSHSKKKESIPKGNQQEDGYIFCELVQFPYLNTQGGGLPSTLESLSSLSLSFSRSLFHLCEHLCRAIVVGLNRRKPRVQRMLYLGSTGMVTRQ